MVIYAKVVIKVKFICAKAVYSNDIIYIFLKQNRKNSM